MRPSRPNRRELLVLGALLALALGALVALATLQFSTSWIERVDESEVLSSPSGRFTAGPLVWDLTTYRVAPTLQVFRDTFGLECSAKTGLDAARCVADIIKAHVPRGDPKIEFVDSAFDPASALRAHLDGSPGHCTTGSAMTATALLSMGVPARIVQVLPTEMRGHNLIEVWDPAEGWLLFDPHYDSSYLLGDSFLSAVKLSQISGGLRWRRPNEGQLDLNLFAGATINYPEPWLYTRVGERCASWPFRGCFAQVGPTQFRYGPAQRLALVCVGVFGGASVVWALLILWKLRRQVDPTGLTEASSPSLGKQELSRERV